MLAFWKSDEFRSAVEQIVSGFLKFRYNQELKGVVRFKDAYTAKVITVYTDHDDSKIQLVDYILDLEYVEDNANGPIRIRIYECEYPEFGVKGVYIGTVEF